MSLRATSPPGMNSSRDSDSPTPLGSCATLVKAHGFTLGCCMGTVESRPEPLIEHLGKGPVALEAQVKAIQLCDQKGWSLAAPLLDPPPSPH